MQNWFLSVFISSLEIQEHGNGSAGQKKADVIYLMERERGGKDEKWWGRRIGG